MGIDIYARWRDQTAEQQEAQYTGFSIRHGNVGYLREAYHGGPYATRELVPEAFGGDSDEAPIAAALMRSRLPRAAQAALIREAQVYGNAEARAALCGLGHEPTLADRNNDPSRIELKDGEGTDALLHALGKAFSDARALREGRDAGLAVDTLEALSNPLVLHVLGEQFDTVRSLIDFVALCEEQEERLGEPCVIIASY